MGRRGANDAVERTGHGLQSHGVGSRAVEQEEGPRLGTEYAPDALGGPLGPPVVAVPGRMVGIGRQNGLHHLGMDARIVIACKTSHDRLFFRIAKIGQSLRGYSAPPLPARQKTADPASRETGSATLHAAGIRIRYCRCSRRVRSRYRPAECLPCSPPGSHTCSRPCGCVRRCRLPAH